jgi:hypothetical protein
VTNMERSKLDLVPLAVGAKLGAIGGRHGATLSLLHRSIQTAHQESSDTQPHRPTREISFASR